MTESRYIVASSKPWHRANFDRLRTEEPGDWAWVTTESELKQAVAALAPRYVFFLHWNWLVPTELWSAYECVCFHMTDVPYGRGGSPLQNLIVRGHKETKLTALRMVDKMDAGPVYAKRLLSLEGRAEDIYRRAGDLSFEIVRWMIDATPEPVQQQGEAVLFKRRKPDQSILPDTGTIESLYDHIRMLDAPSYPLAYIDYGQFRIEFSDAQIDGNRIGASVVIRPRADVEKE